MVEAIVVQGEYKVGGTCTERIHSFHSVYTLILRQPYGQMGSLR
jgi:hypothetical protein